MLQCKGGDLIRYLFSFCWGGVSSVSGVVVSDSANVLFVPNTAADTNRNGLSVIIIITNELAFVRRLERPRWEMILGRSAGDSSD